MATLTIDLQEGFGGEDVVVRVDGQEVGRRRGVRTKRMLGYADSMKVEVHENRAKVEVVVPSCNLEKVIDVCPRETPYLGVSLSGSQLNLLPYPKPFGYA
jgi:hypothetical protein